MHFKYNEVMKKLDMSWVLTIFAMLILANWYVCSEQGIYLSIFIYKTAAICLAIFFVPIIKLAYNNEAMWKLMTTLINSSAARERSISKMSKGFSFWKLPLIIHVICGGCFIIYIEDAYLTMAFLFMIYYFRVSNLILASCTVRHLHNLDNAEEKYPNK
jgi:hypothetical protein